MMDDVFVGDPAGAGRKADAADGYFRETAGMTA